MDRILRYFNKDIMLPIRCYASKKQMFDLKHRCDCRMFCKKTSGGKPVPVSISQTLHPNNRKYYYRIINGPKHKQQQFS